MHAENISAMDSSEFFFLSMELGFFTSKVRTIPPRSPREKKKYIKLRPEDRDLFMGSAIRSLDILQP